MIYSKYSEGYKNFVLSNGYNLKYYEKGEGHTLVLFHGTPGSSVEYLDLINILSQKYKCITVDMLGFGLSDKIKGQDYSIEAHGSRLAEFLKSEINGEFSVLLHDFGGPIGLNAISKSNKKPVNIIAMNTWLGSLNNRGTFKFGYKLFKGLLGKYLYVQYGFSAKVLFPSSHFDKSKIDKDLHQFVLACQEDSISRNARHKFVKELIEAHNTYEFNKKMISSYLNQSKVYAIWGESDKFIKKSELLSDWTSLPNFQKYYPIDKCGHYPQQEATEKLAQILNEILS